MEMLNKSPNKTRKKINETATQKNDIQQQK